MKNTDLKSILHLPGVYLIRVGPHTFYIGSTTRKMLTRQREHLKDLKHGRHCNPHLQRSFNKYGADTFQFFPLFSSAADAVLDFEQRLLDVFFDYRHCANANRKATNGYGCTRPIDNARSKDVRVENLKTGDVKVYKSMRDAARNTIGEASKTQLSKWLRGERAQPCERKNPGKWKSHAHLHFSYV